jgi:hypothetical protein
LDHVKEIEVAVKKDGTWRTQKLVIKIDKVTTIDIAPYLGDGPKLDGEPLICQPTTYDPKGVDWHLQN